MDFNEVATFEKNAQKLLAFSSSFDVFNAETDMDFYLFGYKSFNILQNLLGFSEYSFNRFL